MRHGAKYLLVTTILLAGYCAALQHKTLVPQAPRARVAQPAAPLAANTQEPTGAPGDSQQPLPLVALADTERAAPLDKKTEPFTVNKQPTIERAAPPPEIGDSFQRPFDWSARPAETPSPEPSARGPSAAQRGAEKKAAAAKSAKPATVKQKPTAAKTAERKGSEKKAPAKVATGDRKATAVKPAAEPKLADRKAVGERRGGTKSAKPPKPAGDSQAKNQSEAESQELAGTKPKPADADALDTTPTDANAVDTTPAEPQRDAAQEQPASGSQRHCIAPGDTLAKLAEKYWGDSSQAPELYRANEGVLPDPRLLPIGVEIEIPSRPAAAPHQPAADAENTEPAPERDASGLIPVPPSVRHLPPVNP